MRSTTPVTKPPSTLGPEWVVRDGRVLIEATAVDDPKVLLGDLQQLGLTEGVVLGGLVNGSLPASALTAALALDSAKQIRPRSAGTG